jgi:hypothetical protein
MSDQVSRVQRRWSRSRLVAPAAVAASAVALVAAMGMATPWLTTALRFLLDELVSLADLDWPRWIHNLADLLQIAIPLIAVLAWGGSRRMRR